MITKILSIFILLVFSITSSFSQSEYKIDTSLEKLQNGWEIYVLNKIKLENSNLEEEREQHISEALSGIKIVFNETNIIFDHLYEYIDFLNKKDLNFDYDWKYIDNPLCIMI